jgi:hypothetical protein
LKLKSNEIKKPLRQKLFEIQLWLLGFIFPSLTRLIGKTPQIAAKSSLSPNEAKKFLSRKILETARRNGVDFDALEEKMLYWTSDHEDMDLADKFAEKHNDQDYEKKVAGLLKSSYEHDRESNVIDFPNYKEAYNALLQGDNYLTVMLDKSIGNQFSPVGLRWFGGQSKSFQDYRNLVLTGFVIMVVIIILAFVYPLGK